MKMSKLFDQLRAERTGMRVPGAQRLPMVSSEVTTFELPPDNLVYRVGVRLGAQVAYSQQTIRSGHDFERMLCSQVYRPLAEEIFGEYRKPLINIDLAILEGRTEDARAIINQVLESMFKV